MPATMTKSKPAKSSAATRPRITALKLKDATFKPEEVRDAAYGVWDYDEFLKPAHRDWYENWISFDCLLADEKRGTVWCGIASFTGDIFWALDHSTGRFRSMNYPKVGNRYDAKFHRSLLFDQEGMIWAATAIYHDVNRFHEAPGGAIVRFDPDSEKAEIVARPFPHVYIQSIQLDPKRRVFYGQTYNPEFFFSYEIATGKATNLGPIGGGIGLGQVEQLSIDRNGTIWGAYAVGRAWAQAQGPTVSRLWRYNPDDRKPVFLKHGLPSLDGQGFNKPDGTHTGPDGAVYMGSSDGALYRIDPDSSKVEFIGKPAAGRRLTGLVTGADGNLYGSCGNGGAASLFKCELPSGKLTNFGAIYDPAIGTQAWQVHNMCVTRDGTLYAAENDVPFRSSYLWKIEGVCPAASSARKTPAARRE